MSDATAARVEALEALLVEKGIIDPGVVDEVVDHYESNVGPLNGAKVIARAWTDPGYLQRLLDDGTRAVAELGFGGPEGHMIVAVPNTSTVHNVVVCTLCSCYPWPVLGLPPGWYKSSAYRSRMVAQPRALLSEMGLDLPPEVLVRVWDSSAEARYLVVPERPAGTDGLSEADLARLVTRDSMIGVGRALSPTEVDDR
jgi:nitrile hydratase subunit alpha